MKPRREKRMDDRPAGTLTRTDALDGPTTATRVGEDRAARILERAAALDAKRSSEVEIDQLREAAAAAGISPEAFDLAMAEQDEVPGSIERGRPRSFDWRGAPTVSPTAFTHYTALLRDVLGEDGQIMVVEDRIEWQDEEGLVVSVHPSSNRTMASVAASGRLRGRLAAITLSILPLLLFFFAIAIDEEEALLAFMGSGLAMVAAWLGTWFHFRREQKALRKKVERLRRQLQHLLPPPERA
jgi:hypothetical protein